MDSGDENSDIVNSVKENNNSGKIKKSENCVETEKPHTIVIRSRKRKRIIAVKTRKTGKIVQQILRKELEAPTSKISHEDFNKALKFFKNNKSSRDIYKEKCVAPIHLEKRNARVETGFFVNLLEQARKCLLQKDWNGLARVLLVAKPLARSDYHIYFTVFLTYASICLCHNPDKKLLDVFLQSVLMCTTDEEKKNVFKHFVCLERN